MVRKYRSARPVILLLSLLIMLPVWGFAQSEPSKDTNATAIHQKLIRTFWHRREHLRYRVKYGFLTLGYVIVDIVPDTSYRGRSYREMRVKIKSNPSLPFVGNKEDDFYSLMARNDTLAYETLFWMNDMDDHIHNKELYRLHYDEGKVYSYIKKESHGPLIAKDTLPLQQPSICGPAFFYDFRLYTQPNVSGKIPIYINQKKETVDLHCAGDTRSQKVEALDNKKLTLIKSSGNAGFNGPFGFRGDFSAWFTDDSLRIPVSASLKVWIGSVHVHLESYRADATGE